MIRLARRLYTASRVKALPHRIAASSIRSAPMIRIIMERRKKTSPHGVKEKALRRDRLIGNP
jgi:hypothetical protein